MAEAITSKVKRIISGSANALVDAVEDMAPEMVMEQAIREIDGAIDEVRVELGRVLASKHLASKRLMDENRRHEELTAKIEVAIAEGRDDLAETAVAQQLDIEAQIPILESSIADCSEEEKQLESFVIALTAKKREMQGDLADYRASRKHVETIGDAGGRGSSKAGVDGRVAKAESTFDRLMTKHTGLPASRRAGDAQTAGQMAELEDLTRQHRVQERLAALKSNK